MPPLSIWLGALVCSPDSTGRFVDGLRSSAIWQTEIEAVDLPTVYPSADRSLDSSQLAFLSR